MGTIESLKKECIKCRGCSLWNNPILLEGKIYKPKVFSVGPIPSDIMLVGQNPGKNEILENTPFVGKAGQRLNSCLEESGLKRENVYITNGVKCFTTGNVVPPLESVEVCKHFLKEEIKLVLPKVIIVMGASAFRSFDFEEKFSIDLCKHPRFMSSSVFPNCLITIHPSYINYNPTVSSILTESLKFAREFLENIK